MSDIDHGVATQGTIRVPGRRRRKIKWGAYLFLLPAFVLFAVFVAYPVGFNFWLSFHNWSGGVSAAWEWVGLEHYERMLTERTIRLSLRNSGFFFIGHLVNMTIALLLAVLLSSRIPGRNLARTLIFIPFVVAGSIVAVTWQTIYDPNLGPINTFLRRIGLDALAQNWLADPKLAIWSIVVVGIWAGLGFALVVYLASLQAIDPSLRDAARVDGAHRAQVFRFITFPLLRNTHLVLLILGIIGAVQAFEANWIMTGGGPYGATTSLAIEVYKNVFNFSEFGYGAAISVFTMVILVLLILLQRFLFREQRLT